MDFVCFFHHKKMRRSVVASPPPRVGQKTPPPEDSPAPPTVAASPSSRREESTANGHGMASDSPQPKPPAGAKRRKPVIPSTSKSAERVISLERSQPRHAAYKRSEPQEVEVQKCRETFLKPTDKKRPEDWWKRLSPPQDFFRPHTNPLPNGTSRSVNNKSSKDNIWQHLYESGQDVEKKKLFHASTQSFTEMSKMWIGFKSMREESREITVPSYTQRVPWNQSLRSDSLDQRSLAKRTRPQSSQPSKSPWYQKREHVMRTLSSRFLRSSSMHLEKERQEAGEDPDGNPSSSSNAGGGSKSFRRAQSADSRPKPVAIPTEDENAQNTTGDNETKPTPKRTKFADEETSATGEPQATSGGPKSNGTTAGDDSHVHSDANGAPAASTGDSNARSESTVAEDGSTAPTTNSEAGPAQGDASTTGGATNSGEVLVVG